MEGKNIYKTTDCIEVMEQPQTDTIEEWDYAVPNRELKEIERKRFPATMEYWYPKLSDISSVKTPQTEWVNLETSIIEEGTVHEMTSATYDIEELRGAVQRVGTPAFIRTDMSSNIKDSTNIKITSVNTLELQQCAGSVIKFNRNWVETPFSSLVIREWLDIENYFTVWDGKKAGLEVRFFTSGSAVESWCFDWDKSEISPDQKDWEDRYDHSKQIVQNNISSVLSQAKKVANKFADYGTGSWSVDFVRTTDGEWYCTDMAPRNQSQVCHEPFEL